MEGSLPRGTNFRIVCFQLRNPARPWYPRKPFPLYCCPVRSERARAKRVRKRPDGSGEPSRDRYAMPHGRARRATAMWRRSRDTDSPRARAPRAARRAIGSRSHRIRRAGARRTPARRERATVCSYRPERARTAQTHGAHRAGRLPMIMPATHPTPRREGWRGRFCDYSGYNPISGALPARIVRGQRTHRFRPSPHPAPR